MLVIADICLVTVEVLVVLSEFIKAVRDVLDRDVVNHLRRRVSLLVVEDAHRRVDLQSCALDNLLRVLNFS